MAEGVIKRNINKLTGVWNYLEAGWLFNTPGESNVFDDITGHHHQYGRNFDGDEWVDSELGLGLVIALRGDDQLRHTDDGTRLGLKRWTLLTRIKLLSSGAARVTADSGFGGVIGYPIICKGRGEDDGNTKDLNYFFAFDTTFHLVADYEDDPSGGNHPVIGATALSEEVWYDVACTYDGVNLKVHYKLAYDSIWIEDGSAAYTDAPRSDSIQRFAIGTAVDSTGLGAGTLRAELKWAFVFYESIEADLNSLDPFELYRQESQYIPYTIAAVGGVTVDSWYTVKENPVLDKIQVVNY